MGTPYLSELRIFSFNYAPRGWAICNGQLLPINQNQALFSLLGTTYGGDGQVNFALPNLQGRAPMHMGSSFALGQTGGEQTHILVSSEMTQHTHTLSAVNAAAGALAAGRQPGPAGAKALAISSATATGGAVPVELYSSAAPNQAGLPAGVSSVGGNQAHENMQPYLVLSVCIALQGIFPSRN